MYKSETVKSRLALIGAMCIFGTIGIVRKYIPLPSSIIALARALIGMLFLVLVACISRRKPDLKAIRKHFVPLLLSGFLLGFNWILLFEAYNYTTVATATLCYYMAPMLVILVSPLLFKERLSGIKLLCVLAAFIGVILVSGVLQTGFSGMAEIKGILFGLAAAVFYACVVLLNKRLSSLTAYDKTIMQLGLAGLILIPYCLVTEDISALAIDGSGIVLLIVAGIVHTGIAYALYFGSMKQLKAQTVALYSYIDPVLAILLSALLLKETMTVASGIGAVLILSAAFISDRVNTAS